MGSGKDWNLTDKRKANIIQQLLAQSSVGLIAMHYDICRQTLARKLEEAGIDARELQREGIRKLRLQMYNTLDEIDDPKDKAKLTLDVLKHYDKSDDVATTKQELTTNSVIEITKLPEKETE